MRTWTGSSSMTARTPRAGRLGAEDEGAQPDGEADLVAHDAGIDGGAATAEETAIDGITERAPDLRPVLSSGRTSLPVRSVDSTDVRIGVSD